MANFNKVLLMGNLTRDPELRVTPGGLSICKLGLAVNRNYTTKEGEKREETTFVDCDAFGKSAEIIAKYMSKGRPIFVEGRLRLDEWEDRQSGQKRNKLSVVVDNFQFMGGPGDNQQGGGSGSYNQSSPPQRQSSPPAQDYPQEENFDDDVPF